MTLPTSDRLSATVRLVSFFSGLLVLALLIVARSVEPSNRGFGTHEQLGLPPCTWKLLFDRPCPSCGMTTAWSLATRCRVIEAAEVNLAGLMLAIIALAYLPACCYFSWYGQSSRGGWFSMVVGTSLLASLAIAGVQWLWRIS
jgi:Protein of unknown function (DUF2752)